MGTDKSKAKEGVATTNPCMSGGGVIAGTMTMDGAKTNIDGEVYNNPFEMVPTTGKLMKQMSSTFLSATADAGTVQNQNGGVDNAGLEKGQEVKIHPKSIPLNSIVRLAHYVSLQSSKMGLPP